MGVESPFFSAHRIQMPLGIRSAEIKIFINQALGRVGVHINHDRAAMDGLMDLASSGLERLFTAQTDILATVKR